MTLALSTDEFNFIAGLLKQRSGLSIASDKIYLIESRLEPIAKSNGLKDVRELINTLRQNPPPALVHNVVESMTTNESMFFRDSKPFELLIKHILPELWAAKRTSVRIWSAACSTGQEPYSIAMALKEEAAKYPGLRTEIYATDLADKVVERARDGLYSQFEVQRGLPITHLMKYFSQAPNNMWRIKEEMKTGIRFAPANLLESYALHGRFDIVFCRNVLIYFDEKTKSDVLDRMAVCLNAPGYLFLGGAETTHGLTQKFKPVTDGRGMFTLA